MKVLTGEQSPGALINHKLRELGWGRMYVKRKPEPWAGEPWGFDNDAWGCYSEGRSWDAQAYQDRLGRAASVERSPLLAVMPDIVAAGEKSLQFSLKWREKPLPFWPWYLAVQDGMRLSKVAEVIAVFDGIFLGGSDRFKRWTARDWARLAHDNGKKFHYGRAGTPAKVQAAFRCGADSCDSALPLWSKRKFRNFIQTLNIERNQHVLWRHEDV